MKIGIIQYSPIWESPEENFNFVSDLIFKSSSDTDLIILPEMSLTGFTMNSEKFAEEIDGFAVKSFIALAGKIKKHIFAGIIERDGEAIYNSLFHFDRNGIITARYRKVHPFSYAKENKFYRAGSESVITNIEKYSTGLSICYDLRFPELYRLYGKQRVDIMVNIANWPVKRIEHWKHLLKARAIENQAFMIGVNRTGDDPFYNYNGSSAVYDPMGKELLQLDDESGFFTVEINPDEAKEVQNKFHFLDDIKLI